MGIPFYYKHIVTTYKNIVKHNIPKCHRLYIDYNSIIHQCAGKIVKENQKYTHQDILDNVMHHTADLIKTIGPTEMVYIGVDGVAPRAKMVQQRKRRYITAYKNALIKEACERFMLPSPPEWDSNIITPGTDFMKQLDSRLHHYFGNTKLQCKIIISGSDEKGEGEQKLFDHLRAQPADGKINVINGLDADLIMLSLLSEHTVYLRRDDDSFIDIPEFRECIAKHVDPNNPGKGLMYDYVFLCFLLGNDFIPNIPFLKIRNRAADVLLDIYRKVRETLPHQNLVTFQNTFKPNMIFLKEIMNHLASMEKENMEYAIKQYNDTETSRNYVVDVPDNCPRELKRYLIELEHYPLKHKHPLSKVNIKDTPWAIQYYHELFGSHEPNHVKTYCQKYIEGLVWVLNYYFNRKFDYFWHYKYSVAPLCSDIYKTMLVSDLDPNLLEQDSLNFEITPDLQLLCVIPKRSVNILPDHLKVFMTDPAKGCIHYYPDEFRLCTFMKKFLWECVPLLPEINMERLKKNLQ